MAISNNSTGLRPGVCTSTTRPTNPYEGFMIYETDTDLLRIWNGSAWKTLAAAAPAQGTILQTVESANDTTLRSTTSTTFADSGLTLTITPQASTSKILCVYTINGYVAGSATGLGIRLLRGASTVVGADLDNGYGSASGNAFNTMLYYVDSPATTSATTYKIQYNRNQGATTAYMGASAAPISRFFAMEIAV